VSHRAVILRARNKVEQTERKNYDGVRIDYSVVFVKCLITFDWMVQSEKMKNRQKAENEGYQIICMVRCSWRRKLAKSTGGSGAYQEHREFM